MSTTPRMVDRVRDYLTLRRRFGFRLSIAGEQLEAFARFADRLAPGEPLTTELALRWAQATPTGKQCSAARRLLILRPFARHLRAIEPRSAVPPQRILGRAQYRQAPYIFTDAEVQALLRAARDLTPRGGLRCHSTRSYLSLLLCTGMRPPEPLRLIRTDVDLGARTLVVRETKFSKSRIVVLHPTAAAALGAYARLRDRHVPPPRSSAFFLSDDGTPFTHKKALWAFRGLRRVLGWEAPPGRRPPRLYDCRHTFVCRRLLRWYKDGTDVHVALPSLATYLGHVKVTDTYWYLTAVPELMQLVSRRFENSLCRQEGRL